MKLETAVTEVMDMRNNVIAILSLALLLPGLAHAGPRHRYNDMPEHASTVPVKRPVAYKQYAFNHPHQLPADYVYRTPRVFGPASAQVQTEQFPRQKPKEGEPSPGQRLKGQVAQLVGQILLSSKEPLAGELQVLVASFVNLNQMYESSSFGRYFAEQVLFELQQAGVDVVDVRMMAGMEISQGNGEYILSRDMAELNYVQHADAVLAGTYSVADGQLFVNARLLQNGTGLLLASGSVVFALDSVTAALLQDGAAPVRLAKPVEVPVQAMN